MISAKRRNKLHRFKPKNYEERLYSALLMIWEYWDNSKLTTLANNHSKGSVTLSPDEEWEILSLLYPRLNRKVK